jgi:hypothetical protein
VPDSFTHATLEVLDSNHDGVLIGGFTGMDMQRFTNVCQVLERVITTPIAELLGRSEPSFLLSFGKCFWCPPDQFCSRCRSKSEVKNFAVLGFENDRFHPVAHHLARARHRPERVDGV